MSSLVTYLRASFPIILFLIGSVYLSIQQCPDEKGYWPIVFVSFTAALLLSANRKKSVDNALRGMSQQLVVLMVCSWLLAAILGQFMRESGLVVVFVKFLSESNVNGGLFVACVFLIASLFATVTGTAVGTILLTVPVLFPVGAQLNADPTILLGAILAGGAFGDDYSPMSDTTIASAEGQGVSISDAVRDRFKYILPPAVVAFTLYVLLGSGKESVSREVLSSINIDYSSLWFLLAPITVLVLSFKRQSILTSLVSGILVAIIVGLFTGLIPMDRLFSTDPSNFTATSILIDGMNRGVGISVFSIFLIGTVAIVMGNPVWKSKKLNKEMSSQKSEGLIALITLVTNSVLAHNTIAILSTSPIASNLRKLGGLSRLRVAQIVDISGNITMHIFPYMITVVLAVSMSRKDLMLYGKDVINPWAVGFSNFHSIGLFLMLIYVIASGRWRKLKAS